MVRRDPGQEQEEDIEASGLLTVTEVAKELRVDTTTVRRWVTQGLLEVVTLPHRNKRRGYRIKRATLDNLIEGKTL